jgi:hypothetical protein
MEDKSAADCLSQRSAAAAAAASVERDGVWLEDSSPISLPSSLR